MRAARLLEPLSAGLVLRQFRVRIGTRLEIEFDETYVRLARRAQVYTLHRSYRWDLRWFLLS